MTKIRTVNVTHKGNKLFEATNEEGTKFFLEIPKKVGGSGTGATPIDICMGAIAGCTAIDLVNILEKMREELTSLEVKIETTQREEHPRSFNYIKLTYILSGKNLTRKKIERAVDLSLNKYCSIKASLSEKIKIETEIVINS